MEIKKFENFDSGDYDYPYDGHCFVLGRPYIGWEHFSATSFKKDEFVPCMISGYGNGQRIFIIGHQYAFQVDEFEVIEDSDKNIQEIIDIYIILQKNIIYETFK